MKLQPRPRYYIWLRWLFRQSNRVSPPDPKPWTRGALRWAEPPECTHESVSGVDQAPDGLFEDLAVFNHLWTNLHAERTTDDH